MTDLTHLLAMARELTGDDELTARELAELLWLAEEVRGAARTPAAPAEPPPGDPPAPPSAPPAPPPEAEPPPGEPADDTPPQQPPAEEPQRPPATPLHSPVASGPEDGGGSGGGVAKASPLPLRQPSALPHRLELARALRPLKRRVRAPGRGVLDEPRTADRSARARRPLPALCHASERWLELALVVDESVSMSVWRRTVDDFRALVEGHGAFRDVRMWRFDADEPELVLRYGPGGGDGRTAPGAEGRNPAELHDPAGRRLILVLTDGLGELWGTPAMTGTLRQWARRASLTVVQMLPPDLWHRTWLPPVRAALRATGPARLTVRPVGPGGTFVTGGGCATPDLVPLVTLDPEWLRPWAQAVSGSRTTWRPGSAVDLARAPSHGEPDPVTHPVPEHETSAARLVEEFRTWATPDAVELAFLLSAAPLTLPLMRWLQQTLLPATGPAQLAEVFLSDLLVRPTGRRRGGNPDRVVYEFRDGVRDELASGLTRTRAYQVLTTLIRAPEALAEPFGGSLDFRVLAADPAGSLEIADGRVFATVAASVLGGLGGELTPYAERIDDALGDLDRDLDRERTKDEPRGRVCVTAAQVAGRDVVVTSVGGELWIWDLTTGRGRLAAHGGKTSVTALACATTASGRAMAVALYADGVLAAVDLAAYRWPESWRRGVGARPGALACGEVAGQRIVAVAGPDGIDMYDLDSGVRFLPTVPVTEEVSALAVLTLQGRSHLFTGDTEGVVRDRVLEPGGMGTLPAASGPVGRRYFLSFALGTPADPATESACHRLALAFQAFGCHVRVATQPSEGEYRGVLDEITSGLTEADALIVHLAGHRRGDADALLMPGGRGPEGGRRMLIADGCQEIALDRFPLLGFDTLVVPAPEVPSGVLTHAFAEALERLGDARRRAPSAEPYIPLTEVVDFVGLLADEPTAPHPVLNVRHTRRLHDEFLPNPGYEPASERDTPVRTLWRYPQDAPTFRTLTGWIGNPSASPRLALVLGPEASGKTTLLVTLTQWARREDSGRAAVMVSAAGASRTALTHLLAARLGEEDEPPSGLDELVGRLARRGDQPLIVVDALDETPNARAIVRELLLPLLDARVCRVLVGSRSGRHTRELLENDRPALTVRLTATRDMRRRAVRTVCEEMLGSAPYYRRRDDAFVRKAFSEAVAATVVRRSAPGEQIVIGRAFAGFIASRGEPLESVDEAEWVGSGVPGSLSDVVDLLLADARNPWTRPALKILADARGDGLADTDIQRRCATFEGAPPSLYEVREALVPVRGLVTTTVDARGATRYRVVNVAVANRVRSAPTADPDLARDPLPVRPWSAPATVARQPGGLLAMAVDGRSAAPALVFTGTRAPMLSCYFTHGEDRLRRVRFTPRDELLPQLGFVDWSGGRAAVLGSRSGLTVLPLDGPVVIEEGALEGAGAIEAFTATTSAAGRPAAVTVDGEGVPRGWHLDHGTPWGRPCVAVPRVLFLHPSELDPWAAGLSSGLAKVGLPLAADSVDLRTVSYLPVLRPAPDEPDMLDLDTVAAAQQLLPEGSTRSRFSFRGLLNSLTRRLGVLPDWLPAVTQEFITYLADDARRAAVQSMLAEAVAAQRPRVLITHGMGSVIAYEALWERPELSVELLVTMGTPMGLDAIFPRLQPAPVDGRGRRPPGVRRWVNLDGTLDPLSFSPLSEKFDGVELNIVCEGIGTLLEGGRRSYLNSPSLAEVLTPYLHLTPPKERTP
ncbi:SAV_2336 N-terminal domain-related protein [Streptomyces sp. NPDC048636]|uniref:SAV_2336 N-terminal domain-related protein n=1 Tax=Streptomyces sp. NPDC048636 TaxID=3155762 RepID=UPI0034305435